MEVLIFISPVFWFFGFVIIMTALYDSENLHPCDFGVIAVAVFWPIVAVVGLFVILWDIPFSSAKKIRADLRNRGLLEEFNQWVKDKKEQPHE